MSAEKKSTARMGSANKLLASPFHKAMVSREEKMQTSFGTLGDDTLAQQPNASLMQRFDDVRTGGTEHTTPHLSYRQS